MWNLRRIRAPGRAAPSLVGYARRIRPGFEAVAATGGEPASSPGAGRPVRQRPPTGLGAYRGSVADHAHPDPTTLRALAAHEARVHAFAGRELRDLGDGILLHDRLDPEPFWNRLVAPDWPEAAAAFDRRLDELVTLFATLDRLAHVRPLAFGNSPEDLPDRLRRAGFVELGADAMMVLVDTAPALAVSASAASTSAASGRIEVDRIHLPADGPETVATAAAVAAVLTESFGVEPGRRVALAAELRTSFGQPAQHTVLIRIGDVPAAVARRATFDGLTYLSSIGTRPGFRNRGLGTLVTAIATADAVAAGSRLIHLAVQAENRPARTMYERLGYRIVGDPTPDLLLER